MGVTVVAGVRGVGVSAICTSARSALSDDYELVNFGDVMLEQAAVRGMAVERSELGELSIREIQRLQRRAGEYVADRARACEVLLSTHLVVETGEGLLPGLPGAVLSDVSPDRFVLVEATPETIAMRRDDDVSIGQLAFQDDLTRAAAMGYAIREAVPIELIDNEGEPEEAAAELVAVVES